MACDTANIQWFYLRLETANPRVTCSYPATYVTVGVFRSGAGVRCSSRTDGASWTCPNSCDSPDIPLSLFKPCRMNGG